jgi:hypothetical protein
MFTDCSKHQQDRFFIYNFQQFVTNSENGFPVYQISQQGRITGKDKLSLYQKMTYQKIYSSKSPLFPRVFVEFQKWVSRKIWYFQLGR